jgi:tRNA threonylcarbamoyl adenosine modification protein YeaZ
MVDEVLRDAAVAASAVDAIAATVGPGSFTGLRAALALAHGIGLATGRPVLGVTVGEAFAEALPRLGGRSLWTTILSRKDHLYVEHDGRVEAVLLAQLPPPPPRLALAGDAATAVAVRLAARGVDVMLTDARLPRPRDIAAAAARQLDGSVPRRPPMPLYVDGPSARRPDDGRRAQPA